MKATFVDFAKNTSIHGIKYTVLPTTSILERIFWISTLLSSLTFAGYLTIVFWARYTSNPTRTTLKTAFAPTSTVPFPGVTICNDKQILWGKVDKFLTKLDASEQELLTLKNLFHRLIYSEKEAENAFLLNVSELEVAQNVLELNDYADMRRLMKRVSQSCEDMILRCAWNKRPVECKDIFQDSFTNSGRCCSFNYRPERFLKSALYTLHNGLSTGLTVLLRPEHNGHLAGVTVITHSPDEYASTHENTRSHLPVGRVTYLQIEGSKRECSPEVKVKWRLGLCVIHSRSRLRMSLTRTNILFICQLKRVWGASEGGNQVLPIGHRQCLYAEEKQLEYFSKYAETNCMAVCEALSMFRICGCVPHHFDFIDDKPICDVRKWACLHSIKNVTAESCGCLSQCEDEFYDVTMTSGKFVYTPNVWKMDFLDGVNDTEHSILLNIFFATNRQSIWIRDTMTSGVYLISSFGGIYSLFLGCSIITLIEILYYCIGKCVIKHICRKEKRIDTKTHAKPPPKVTSAHDVYAVSRDIKEQRESKVIPIMPFVN